MGSKEQLSLQARLRPQVPLQNLEDLPVREGASLGISIMFAPGWSSNTIKEAPTSATLRLCKRQTQSWILCPCTLCPLPWTLAQQQGILTGTIPS